MKKIVPAIVSMVLLLLAGCSGGRYMEMTNAGESYCREGDFQAAWKTTGQVISEIEAKGRHAPGKTYAVAGVAAYELGRYDSSLSCLLKAQQQEYSDGQLFLYLALNYRQIDNLSKEINALETYTDRYPDGTDAGTVRQRLFHTCLESENYELGEELWNGFDGPSRENLDNRVVYLQLNRRQDRDKLCDSMAWKILEKDPVNEAALDWFAESCFWKAENTYQYHMKAYKENRTRKQYAILLEAFKQVNSDFRKSRDYYLKLYRLYPKPEYAGYLARIFTRLEDEEKADYYRKRAD